MNIITFKSGWDEISDNEGDKTLLLVLNGDVRVVSFEDETRPFLETTSNTLIEDHIRKNVSAFFFINNVNDRREANGDKDLWINFSCHLVVVDLWNTQDLWSGIGRQIVGWPTFSLIISYHLVWSKVRYSLFGASVHWMYGWTLHRFKCFIHCSNYYVHPIQIWNLCTMYFHSLQNYSIYSRLSQNYISGCFVYFVWMYLFLKNSRQ